jgi:hypothetical protein
MISSSKRGQTFIDVLVIAIILVVTAITFVVVSVAQKNISDELLSSGTVTGQAATTLTTFSGNYTAGLDTAFLVVFVLLWVFIILSSLFVDANPIFLIVSFILLVVVLIVIGVMSNAYQEIIVDSSLYTFATAFPKMNYIVNHLVLMCVFIAISSLLAIYGKNSVIGGGV